MELACVLRPWADYGSESALATDAAEIRAMIERWADAVHAGALEAVVADHPRGERMAADRGQEINALLAESEAAHGTYETTELKGVYDPEWARWYADYMVEHGIRERLGHEVTADRLAGFLASSFDEFKQADPKPRETWGAYTARRIAEEL